MPNLSNMKFNIGWLILIAAAVIIGLSWMLTGLPTLGITVPNSLPVSLSLVVVFAVSTLVVLLFIMASAFHYLGLDDRHQPLGLPEGSVRALIALILIMVFIIFGIYLFQTVAGGGGVRLEGVSQADLISLGPRVFAVAPNTSDSATFDVTLQGGITEDGARLAQQILTTVGTLVVAVAGFYFGSSAVAAARGVAAPAGPTIASISPEKISNTDADIRSKTVTVIGSGFADGAKIMLKQSDQVDLLPTSSSASPTQITGTFDLTGKAGKWDVLVTNPDGTAVFKEGAVEISEM